MIIGVAYAKASQQVWTNIELPDGATVKDAIEASGILGKFPEIDLDEQKVGIFGKLAKLDAKLADGDRVEIYRPIIADPDMVERRDQ